jgi:hypothetical protein
MAGKYTPLEQYLRGLPVNQKEVTLNFEQIEGILIDKLPNSAKEYSAWWNNEVEGTHVQARGWMDAGWLVDMVNFTEKWVRFAR